MLGIGVLGLVVATGCGSSDDAGKLPDASTMDAAPMLAFERFTSVTWSLATTGTERQLLITTRPAGDGCGLAGDQHRKPTGAGVQILVHFSETSTDKCPFNNNIVVKDCRGVDAGANPFVTTNCAYWRKFDDAGNLTGFAPAINGLIQFSGTSSQCAIRANVGFVGGVFDEFTTLTDGAAAEPWCRES